VILCINHSSFFDPLVLRAKIKRRINFMAKKELFKNNFFGSILKNLGVFPVDRNKNDLVAYKHALNIIKSQKILGIFIQGTRNKEIQEAKDGAAMFAIKSGAPVVPVAISSKFKIFSRVKINIGEKINFEIKKRVDQNILSGATAQITEQIKKLI